MERVPLIPLFIVEGTYVLLRNEVLANTSGSLQESLLTILRILAAGILFWIYRKFLSISELRKLPQKSLYQWPFWCSLVFLSIYAVINTQGTGDNFGYSLLMFIVTPFVGIHEELANRRILQHHLRSRMGLLPTLVISNLIFCLFHFGVYGSFHFRDYGEIFLVGIFLGILYDRTRSLLLVAFLHTVYDWVWIFGPFLNLSSDWLMASLLLLGIPILTALKVQNISEDSSP